MGTGHHHFGAGAKSSAGQVIGIDIEDSQFARAREQAEQEFLRVEFRKASIYELPFEAQSFDAVFSHALLQHLGDPIAALVELRHILKPCGVIGIRAGESGGILIDAEADSPIQELAAHFADREKDGGDPYVGRKLGRLLREVGLRVDQVTASYEVVSEILQKIGPSLGASFPTLSYRGLQDETDDSLFVALAWCEAIGTAP